MHHYNHIDLILKLVLNLICPFVLYITREGSFISTQLFVLNLDGSLGVFPKDLIFFDITLFNILNLDHQ